MPPASARGAESTGLGASTGLVGPPSPWGSPPASVGGGLLFPPPSLAPQASQQAGRSIQRMERIERKPKQASGPAGNRGESRGSPVAYATHSRALTSHQALPSR